MCFDPMVHPWKRSLCFEQEWADYIGAKYCVGLASGLDALWISFRVLGIDQVMK